MFLCLLLNFLWLCALCIFPQICSCFLNVLVFNVWLLTQEKQKMNAGREGNGPLNFLEITSARGRGLARKVWWEVQKWLPAFFTSSRVTINNQSTDPQYLEYSALFTHPSYCKLFQEHLYSCLPYGCGEGGGWVAAMFQKLKLTKTNYSLPFKFSLGRCKPSINSRIPKSLYQTDFASIVIYGERDFWCFLLHHLP